MGQALYRKYRSKSLGEIVGQEHITKTLDQALRSGRISHAYLFTGPHGVGKTSIARILAHEVNGLPYTSDSSHIDIIEIDAASNRRIDEIRDLRDKVYIAPASAKYKVYIIDEVHMLTREAFNALLKTLEEPPSHVIFILATTDAHKLPETIVSRTQRFTFKPVETAKVVAHLKYIAKQEKIAVSDDALELLAKHGQGSFRDSISLLDQASASGKKLEVADVLALLGIPSDETISKLLQNIANHAAPSVIFESLSELFAQGYQASAIAKQLGQLLRRQLIAGASLLNQAGTLALLKELINVSSAADPERLLEIVLLEAAQSRSTTAQTIVKPEVVPASVSKPAKHLATTPKLTNREPDPSEHEKENKIDQKPTATTTNTKQSAASITKLTADDWPKILKALKSRHNTLYGVARMAQPEFTDGTLKLHFGFSFHQKRLNEAKNRQILTEIVQQATGRAVTVECLVDKTATAPRPTVPATPDPPTINTANDLVTISNIFGGGELLES